MLIIGLIFFITILVALSYGFVSFTKEESKGVTLYFNTFLVLLYFIAWIIFFVGLFIHENEYYVPIDPVDSDYTPLSFKHTFSFSVFFVLSILAIYNIWKSGKKQPPLLFVCYLSLLIIGIVLNFFLALQLFSRSDGNNNIDSSGGHIMMIAPFIHVVFSVFLLLKVMKEERIDAEKRVFTNKFLNHLNTKLQQTNILPLWTIIALLPIFIIITDILVLFGQEVDSLTKVFTETTTWQFSQKTHPPYLDHNGHYLCTVAACGTPKVVKPIRIGIRHGEEIIVNRQLLIANAFEDIITKKYPRIHSIIRRNYDKYGYPLSKDINTKLKSNLTYILMKPFEWFFLLFIYLQDENPEKLINEQYKSNTD